MSAPVNEPVPTINLSELSSHPINALSEEPLSITKPASLAGEPEVPFPSSISESLTTVFVVSIVVVVPLTVKSPVIIASPATVNPVPLRSCKSVEVSRAPILLEPAFLNANSIKPSSVVSVTSEIFPVIFAYTTSWSASFSPLNFN